MNEDLQVIEKEIAERRDNNPQRGTKMEEEKKQIKRIPTGNGKRILKLVSTIILTCVFLCAITWIVSLFLPNNVERAIEILKDLFK